MAEIESHTPRRGRPRSEAAESHATILDAAYELLQEKSARDLTMEEVAKRARVGRPTLYKWWPTKSALVFAVFHERIANQSETVTTGTAEQAIRSKALLLVQTLNGLFGKVIADLIAEGQSEPQILNELYERHIKSRRAATAADIERGIAGGEFRADTDPQLLIDAIFSPIYIRQLLRHSPLTERYVNDLMDQVLRGVRVDKGSID